MEFVSEEEKLLEPIKYYKTEFAEKFLEKITSHFEELLKNSNIDVEANRKSVQEYNDLTKDKAKNERKLKFLDICSGVLFLAICYFGFWDVKFILLLKKLIESKGDIQETALRVAFFSIVIILILIFNFKFLGGKKKKLREKISDLETTLQLKKEECYAQVNPFLSLFDSNISNRIITEVIPTLDIDKNFKIERYANLVMNFGLSENLKPEFSTKDIISGEILGNPFIVLKSLYNQTVDQVYTGSRVVTWTEYYTENGQRKSRTVSQTLTASIVKPKQVFHKNINLIYGNEVAEHLIFSREPKFVHELTPRKLEKHIKKKEKEIKKMSEKAIKEGKSFLEMGNSEFDALFHALDRNNEVEFRVLFTPIAQKNMIEVIKDKDFGDDFHFYKEERLNIITNNKEWTLNINKDYYNDFSFDVIKEKYFNVNKEFFSNFYRLFLPILTIPIYHQHKSQDYIYGKEFNYNYNPYSTEVLANCLGESLFSHPETTTQSILKTRTIRTQGDVDLVEVIGNSYKEVPRVEYIPVRADNGRVYDVPVDWVEYVPLSACGNMEVKKVDIGERDFYSSTDEEFFKATNNKKYVYKNNLFAIFNNESELKCDKIISTINNK
ncbi:MAG1210 family protein [Fusobacterium sp.]|uniref:MAG1210 family protein n=1 Tax=Fusobacterium sp. TaxID=68766 RepID=UPI0026287549|nr:hypothetical protein [Fusobacterium sp.]